MRFTTARRRQPRNAPACSRSTRGGARTCDAVSPARDRTHGGRFRVRFWVLMRLCIWRLGELPVDRRRAGRPDPGRRGFRTVVPRRGAYRCSGGPSPAGSVTDRGHLNGVEAEPARTARPILPCLSPPWTYQNWWGCNENLCKSTLVPYKIMRPEATATPGDSILTDGGHLLILLWGVVLSSCRVPSYAGPGLLRVSPRCRRPTGWSRPRPRDVGMTRLRARSASELRHTGTSASAGGSRLGTTTFCAAP